VIMTDFECSQIMKGGAKTRKAKMFLCWTVIYGWSSIVCTLISDSHRRSYSVHIADKRGTLICNSTVNDLYI